MDKGLEEIHTSRHDIMAAIPASMTARRTALEAREVINLPEPG